MKQAARVDENHKIIVDALRKAGRSVLSLHQIGHGCPDILVGHHGVNYLLEIKVKGGELNEVQEQFHTSWKGQKAVIFTIDEALKITK